MVEARASCGSDNRLLLTEDVCFRNEARPSSGAGSAADRSWMYEFKGAFLVGDDPMETRALAYLQKAVSKRMKSNGRDLVTDNFCRVLQSIRRLASARSSWVEQALSDPVTPISEVAEYVADQWRQMVGARYPFILSGRLAQRNTEIGLADALLHGKDGH